MKKIMKTFVKMAPLAWILIFGGELTAQEISRETVGLEVQKHFANPTPPTTFVQEIAGEGDLIKLVNAFFVENFLYVDYLSRELKDYQGGLVDSVCAFLEAQGNKVPGYSPPPKTPVAIHDVKAIAVRHLFPLRTSPEGKIATLICASALGFKDCPERNITVESFAFQTIFNDIKKEDSFILAKVKEYAELAKSLRFSTNPEDLIKRAQGMFWILFYQNAQFEKLLFEAYSKKATILPFEIVTN
jgi:hypothetical protein